MDKTTISQEEFNNVIRTASSYADTKIKDFEDRSNLENMLREIIKSSVLFGYILCKTEIDGTKQ